MLVGQRLHISHDHHLIRSWGIRHAKRFDVDEVLYQHCVKKLLVGYLARVGGLELAIGGQQLVFDEAEGPEEADQNSHGRLHGLGAHAATEMTQVALARELRMEAGQLSVATALVEVLI